uniref:Uncharacterized protein n=1 Tax=Pristionchus pacificus TaxID=54126 RepID=A0A2A6BTX9_PRIPA|eukprot:PDM69348.1 hypothetical protein PRIPAC_47650 [Pristionchus pacificus]
MPMSYFEHFSPMSVFDVTSSGANEWSVSKTVPEQARSSRFSRKHTHTHTHTHTLYQLARRMLGIIPFVAFIVGGAVLIILDIKYTDSRNRSLGRALTLREEL